MSTFQFNHHDTSQPIWAIYRNPEDRNRWSYQLFDERFPASAMETHYNEIESKMKRLLGPSAFPIQTTKKSAQEKAEWLNYTNA